MTNKITCRTRQMLKMLLDIFCEITKLITKTSCRSIHSKDYQ